MALKEGPTYFKQVTQWVVQDGGPIQQLVIAEWLWPYQDYLSIGGLCYTINYNDAMKLGEFGAKTTAFVRMVTPKIPYDAGFLNAVLHFICPDEPLEYEVEFGKEYINVVNEAIGYLYHPYQFPLVTNEMALQNPRCFPPSTIIRECTAKNAAILPNRGIIKSSLRLPTCASRR